MAGEGEEDVDYESDPEEAMLPLAMRRREASDDEEGDGEEGEKSPRNDPRLGIDSDGESEGEGGAPAYDDEESEIEEEEEEEEEVEEEEIEEVEEVDEGERELEEGCREGRADVDAGEVEVLVAAPGSGGDGERSSGEPSEFHSNGQNQAEDERKENEPFAVPTAGAFYMHDDRFRDNGGGRHRRTPGGRKLWESKDDRKWGHDKFEEMNLQETHYEGERRKSKGRYRGGKTRGDPGYARGSRSKGYGNGNNQNRSSKVVRGRGPRRYEPPAMNDSEPPPMIQNKQYGMVMETNSNASSGRVHTNSKNVQSDRVPPRKNVIASSLSSASPPFYPSGSSTQDISVPQKRDVQSGNANRNLSPSGMEGNYSTPHSNTYRGKNASDPIGMDRPYIAESVRPVSGKQLSNMQLQASGTPPIIRPQSPQSRAQGRVLTIPGQHSYQPASPLNQVNRVSSEAQPSSVQPRPVQIPVHPLRASTQQFGQRPGSGSQGSSPPKAPSRNSPEPGESESPPSSSKFKTALVGKGKGNVQGSGRGSFLYSGAQIIGATGTMGVAHGDQSFPATPGVMPVMQFGGQHPGGLGVPAVGMALPGYFAQPQLGFGNSEMTWVPVLAGAAAGALGAAYCSPYVSVDGGYYARPSGQTSSLGSSGKDTISNKPNGSKLPQKPELVNDEFGQRQNKPRRYSEMNFGQ
ncbi:hypothetical protein NE237_029264 [Protea cynaroides]|uniref:Btz domain-containing protein n=1 Tax=Protea cynaroides TaxID=273540 RepID=A0A9Q0GQW6_9MAGN|nr:hypothetical protein NE237_029264 [Protea cynaroides]